jgi:hypothetical protein
MPPRASCFDEKAKIAAQDVKFVNLVVDAGTASGIKLAYVRIAKPFLLLKNISVELYEVSS